MDQFRFSAVSATYVLLHLITYLKGFFWSSIKARRRVKLAVTRDGRWELIWRMMVKRIKFTRKNWKVIASIYGRKKVNEWTNSSNSDNNDLLNNIFRWSNPLPFYIPLPFFFFFAYFLLDCKTVGFFLSPVSLSVFSLVSDLLFDCSRVLEYAKIRTVLQSELSKLCSLT